MEIRLKCPGCGKKFKVGEEHGGKQAKCPECGKVLIIPAPAAQPQGTDQPGTPPRASTSPPSPPEPVRREAPSETPVEYRASRRRSSFLTGNALVLAKWAVRSGVVIICVVIIVHLWTRIAEEGGIELSGGGNDRPVASDAGREPEAGEHRQHAEEARKADRALSETKSTHEFEGRWRFWLVGTKPGTTDDFFGPRDGDSIVFTRDAFTLKEKGDKKKDIGAGTYKLDDKKDPRQVDLTPSDGSHKGNTYVGVYKFDGGELLIRCSQPGGKRPAGFRASDEGDVFMVLRRERQ